MELNHQLTEVENKHSYISLTKQQVCRHRERDTHFYRRQNKNWTDPNGQTGRHVVFFLRKYRDNYFYRYNILMERVFVIELCSNARISVGRTVWVTTNRCYMGDIFKYSNTRVKKKTVKGYQYASSGQTIQTH
jgi:hypothetical protein